MPDTEPSRPLSSMAPPDPPLPRKTWRGTLVISAAVLVFLSVIGFAVFRWAQFQSFSPELHSEGYHRVRGTLAFPELIFGTDMVKLHVKTQEGKELVLPPVPEIPRGERTFASMPAGTCVEGYVHLRKGYIAQMKLDIEGTTYLLSGEADWVITKDAGDSRSDRPPADQVLPVSNNQ